MAQPDTDVGLSREELLKRLARNPTAAPVGPPATPPPAARGDLDAPLNVDDVLRRTGGVARDPNEMEGNFLTRAWKKIAAAPHEIAAMATGEGRSQFPDRPEFGGPGGSDDIPTEDGKKLISAALWAGNDKQLQDMILANVPGTKRLPDDSHGNPMVEYQGKPMYVNKPGFSGADMMTTLGLGSMLVGAGSLIRGGFRGAMRLMAGAEAPAVLAEAAPGTLAAEGAALRQAAGAATRLTPSGVLPAAGPGLAARAATDALAGAVVSPVQDIVTGAFGSEQGVDPYKAAAMAAGGAAGQVLGSGIGAAASLLARGARSGAAMLGIGAGPQRIINTSAAPDALVTRDMLTDAGHQALEAALAGTGRDVGTLTVGQLQRVQDLVGGNVQPALLRTAIADTLNQSTGVPLTLGQRSGNLGQLAREGELLRTGIGSPSQRTMAAFGDRQITAVQEAATGVAGSHEVEATLGQNIQRGIQPIVRRAETREDLAWPNELTPGGAGGQAAHFTPDAGDPIRDLVARTGREYQNLTDYTRLRSGLAELDGLVNEPVTLANGTTVSQPRNFNLGEFDLARKNLSQLINDTSSNGERTALIRLKEGLDNAFEAARANNQVRGDFDILDQYRHAQQLSREKFAITNPQGNPSAASVMQTIMSPDSSITGKQIVDRILGEGRIGTKSATPQIVDHLATITGEQGPAWRSIQEAAALKTVFGETTPGDVLTPQRIANNIRKALLGDGAEMLARMLPAEQRAAMLSYAEFLDQVATSANRNPAGSGWVASDAMRKMLGNAWGIRWVRNALEEAARNRDARIAVDPDALRNALSARPINRLFEPLKTAPGAALGVDLQSAPAPTQPSRR